MDYEPLWIWKETAQALDRLCRTTGEAPYVAIDRPRARWRYTCYRAPDTEE
jgi:hypothetical protein